jgi:cell division protein FtsN
MARDYKSASKPAAKKDGNPMFTGILIGLFVGLAAALAVAFYVMRSPSPFVVKEKPATTSETALAPKANATAAKPPAQETKPRFDFYTILPGTEEPVTEQEIKQASQKPTGPEKDSYYLQAGAFQKESDADNLKAKLALMGVEAVIQTANLPEKGVWHRVRVGPYTTLDEINRVRTTLIQNSIETSLIKTKEPVPASAR